MRTARSHHAASIRYAGPFSGPRSAFSPRAPRYVDARPFALAAVLAIVTTALAALIVYLA
jgi:hypothetical protein